MVHAPQQVGKPLPLPPHRVGPAPGSPDPAPRTPDLQPWATGASSMPRGGCHRRRAVCATPHRRRSQQPLLEHSRVYMEQPRPPPPRRSRSWTGAPELPNWGWPEDGGRDQIRAGDGRIRRGEAKLGPQEPASGWHLAGKYGCSCLKLERKREGEMEKHDGGWSPASVPPRPLPPGAVRRRRRPAGAAGGEFFGDGVVAPPVA